MPLDPSIALQVKPPQIMGGGDLISLQNMAQQSQLGRLQQEDMMQARSEKDQLRSLFSTPGNIDPKTGTVSLGAVEKAFGISPTIGSQLGKDRRTSLKEIAEMQKLDAETRLKQMEAGAKQADIGKQVEEVAISVYDQARARNIPEEQALRLANEARIKKIDDLVASGLGAMAGLTPEVIMARKSEAPDPMQWKSRALNYNQFLTDFRAQQGQDITVRGQNMTASTAAAGQAITVRGQNMADARAREAGDRAGRTYDAERGVVVNTQTGAATPVTQGGAPIPAKLSEAQKKELSTIDAQVATIQGALKDVEKTPSAFGMKRGLATMAGAIPESVAGRMDSKDERETRSMVFNVVSKVINERAGAAQSAQELARLRSFLPAETDNADQVKDKLNAFEKYLGSQREAWSKAQGGAPGVQSVQKEVEGAGWSYEPTKYEYRVVNGKVQRKAKNG